MNNQVKVFALALCFCSSLVSASSVLDNEEAQKEARTVFTSGGTYYLALNTTYLIYYGIIIGLGLLAAFLANRSILHIGDLKGTLVSALEDFCFGAGSSYEVSFLTSKLDISGPNP